MKAGVDRNVLYMNYAVGVSQNLIQIAIVDQDIYFQPMTFKYAIRSAQHLINSNEFANIYNAKRIEVMSSANENVIWNEKFANEEKKIVGFAQIFFDETATTLKSSVLVVYAVHVVLLNFSTQFKRWQILKELTVVGLFFVGCSSSKIKKEHGVHSSDDLSVYRFPSSTIVQLFRLVSLPSRCTTHKRKMLLLPGNMTQLLKSLPK